MEDRACEENLVRSQKTPTSINKGTDREFLDKDGMFVQGQETIC